MELSQLCAANYHYKRYTLDYFLESAERLGYQSIELWASGPHLHLEDFDAARLAELNRKIKAHHLALRCFTPEQCVYAISVSHPDKVYRDRTVDFFQPAYRSGRAAGLRPHGGIHRLCLSRCGCRGCVWLVCRGNGTHCPQGRAGGRDAGGRAFYQVHHPHLQ